MKLEYDDSQLDALWRALAPKERRKTLRAAFRNAGKTLKRVAENNLTASGLGKASEMAKGIRVRTLTKAAGVNVTIGTRGAAGKKAIHKNRYGQEKPVMIFAEGGTVERRTKRPGKHRTLHATGRMKAYCFMIRTKEQTESSVTNDIHNEIRASIEKTAKKYGCK